MDCSSTSTIVDNPASRFALGIAASLSMLGGLAMFSGCSGGNGMIGVEGTVQVDGTPVAEGLISFVPASGDSPSAQAKIKEGAFQVEVAPGEKIVRIEGFEIVGQEHAIAGNPSSPLVPIRRNIVPDKYNVESDLRRTIDKESTQQDFELTSS